MEDHARAVDCSVIVEAPVQAVWDAWTTESGIRTFFAPDCRMELRVDGPFEIFFDLSAPPGHRGSEGMRILAVQPLKMLSFTWNAPPSIPAIRGQRTHVTVRFEALDAGRTRVTLRNDGYGIGGDWDRALAYFESAWSKVVLPRLVERFRTGPVSWG